MNKYLAYSVMVMMLLIGIGIGFYLTPEYAVMQKEKQSDAMSLGKADYYVDLRYIDGMIAHHKAALYLMDQARDKSGRKEIKELAEVITDIDTKGIADLYALKKSMYGNTKEIAQYQKVNLGEKDKNFDLRFLNALIIHHEEAIAVASEVMTKSTRTETLTVANEVITLLSDNMKTLKQWREQWYGIK